MLRKIFIFLMLLLLVYNVSAIGITPGKTTFDYQPGVIKKVDFSVINSEKQDMDLVVIVQGELNSSVSLSEVSLEMKASEESKTLSYVFTMPDNLKPGYHHAEVVVIQLPKKSSSTGSFVGAALGVATQIQVFVPYPGKYAEAALNVIGPDENGEIIFAIPVISRGNQDLARVRATIDIYGLLNEKIATVNSEQISIISQERKELVARWTPNVSSGTYRAVATIIYDEQTLTLESQFNVGSPLLKIQEVEVNDFRLGEIAKFEFLVENKWSQTISGAYLQMLVYDASGQTIADFKSQTYDAPALQKIVMVAFWDTAGIRKGTYSSSAFLKYGSNSLREDLKLEVSDNRINVIGTGYVISTRTRNTSGLTIILVSIISVLVIINLLWFMFLRKKLSKSIGRIK